MTDGNGLLKIDAVALDGVNVLRVCGEVDTSNAHELEEALLSLPLAPAVVDLTALEYIDSTGVRALDRGLSAIAGRGGPFRAVAPSDSPARLTLRVSGYDESAIGEDVATAVAGLTADGAT